MRKYELSKIYQGRLKKGDDIIQGITEILKDNAMNSGVIFGIGAVSSAKLGYFNQVDKKYEEEQFDEMMEIVSLNGNISIKNNEPFPHLHAAFSKRDFSAIGGHLLPGTMVYAFEFAIFALDGEHMVREFDADTGLFIWQVGGNP